MTKENTNIYKQKKDENMVANKNKLRGKMAENEISIAKLAQVLDVSDATVRYKINSDKYEFNLRESVKIKELLNLSDNEYLEIFIYG